jgi:hypothetical protein
MSSRPPRCRGYLGWDCGDEVRQPLPVNPLCSRPCRGSVTANLEDTRSASFHLTLIVPPRKLSSATLAQQSSATSTHQGSATSHTAHLALTSRSPRKQGSLTTHLALTSQARSSRRTYLTITSQAHSSQLTLEAHLTHLVLLAWLTAPSPRTYTKASIS